MALAEQPQRGHQRHQLALRQRRGRRPRPQPDLARLAVDAGLAGQHVRRAELPPDPSKPDSQEEYEAHVAVDGLDAAKTWLATES